MRIKSSWNSVFSIISFPLRSILPLLPSITTSNESEVTVVIESISLLVRLSPSVFTIFQMYFAVYEESILFWNAIYPFSNNLTVLNDSYINGEMPLYKR